MKKGKAVDITYNKQVGGSGQLNRFESSDRTIIPTILPSRNVKALDVTDLTKNEVEMMEKRAGEYNEFYKTAVANIVSFENWLEMSYEQYADKNVKWRTFTVDGIDEH